MNSEKNTPSVKDKIKGSIFGHALGNAIGNPLKFATKKSIERNLIDRDSFSFPLQSKYKFNHNKQDSENSWTDSTDFLILTIQSLIENKGKIKPLDVAKKLKKWEIQGIEGIGRNFRGIGGFISTISSVEEFEKYPIKIATQFKTASNGSVVRTPCLSYIVNSHIGSWNHLKTILYESKLLCCTTHSDQRCIVSCLVINTMLYNIIYDKECNFLKFRKLLTNRKDQIEFDRYTMFDELSECELDGTDNRGYFYNEISHCFKIMGASVWTYKNLSRGFEEVIKDIALEGGDVDNNCAIAGCLLGADCGFDKIPPKFLDNLKYKEWLEDLSNKFLDSNQLHNEEKKDNLNNSNIKKI